MACERAVVDENWAVEQAQIEFEARVDERACQKQDERERVR